jgi:hypothetical protein
MKYLPLFALACSLMANSAFAAPDALESLKKQPDRVDVYTLEDVTKGTGVFRVELCVVDGPCILFESDLSKSTELADYAYLFAVYVGGEKPAHTRYGDIDYPLTKLVDEAKRTGYAKALLAKYSSQYGCGGKGAVDQCVLSALYKAAGIHRYLVNYDEGIFYEAVDEYGNELKP